MKACEGALCTAVRETSNRRQMPWGGGAGTEGFSNVRQYKIKAHFVVVKTFGVFFETSYRMHILRGHTLSSNPLPGAS